MLVHNPMLSTGQREEWGGLVSALYGHWETWGLSIVGDFNLQHMGSEVATKGEKKVEDYPQEIFISQNWNWPLSIGQNSALWLQHDCWNRSLGILPHTVPGAEKENHKYWWALELSALSGFRTCQYCSWRACRRGPCCPVLFLHTYPTPSSCPLMFLSPHSHTISFLPASSLLFYLTPWGRET